VSWTNLPIKKIILFLIVLFVLKWCSSGFQIQYKLSEHSDIGKETTFSKPICYINRKGTPAIVPIISKINNEITTVHVPFDSESINQYILSNTLFKVTNVYNYRDIMNKQTLYYVLSDQNNKKYILGQGSYYGLQKPISPDTEEIGSLLDELYLNKGSIKMKVFETGKENHRFIAIFFDRCNIKTLSVNYKKRVAHIKVDFKQLVCLYDNYWNNPRDKDYPVSYEIFE